MWFESKLNNHNYIYYMVIYTYNYIYMFLKHIGLPFPNH